MCDGNNSNTIDHVICIRAQMTQQNKTTQKPALQMMENEPIKQVQINATDIKHSFLLAGDPKKLTSARIIIIQQSQTFINNRGYNQTNAKCIIILQSKNIFTFNYYIF